MKKKYNSTIIYAIVFLITLAFCQTSVFAGNEKKNRSQSKQTGLWQQIDESLIQKRGAQRRLPEKYLVFRLNQPSLKSSLGDLPLENSEAARENPLVMEVPMPDGSIQKFRMEETQVLSPELAAQYPSWKTFVGYGIDNPQAVGRFDWNIQGFHGYVESGKGTVLIDPYQKDDTENYLVFYKHEYGSPDDEFSCKVKDDMAKIVESDYKPDFLPNASEFSFGATLRTYRIAIATTGEWSRNAAGAGATTPQQIRDGALAVVVTTLNRLIGIYVRELSSSFQLVNPPTNSANNIIFDDPTTDPYNNIDTSAELNANQSTLDTRVGTASYDIGHLYGTNGGGVASSPGLCRGGQGPVGNAYPNNKAKGYSARGTNTGDPFTVDYVAHEIGHQFGAGHTYNNVDPSGTCTTRSAANAFEVASGATIMSYVGICGARNLQQFVDAGLPSFHIRSLTQIDENIRTDAPSETPGCGPASGTNAVPTVNAGASFNIPKLTPFTLTATGGDTDDPAANLLYSWEQYDLAPAGGSGTSGTPAGTYDVDTDGLQRPLFRVYSPVAGSTRTFPSLNFILNPQNNDATADVNGVRGNQPVLTYQGTHPTNAPGAVCGNDVNNDPITCVIGERLPTIDRLMNFRVSLRDRRGGMVDAGTTVTVAAGAGPFQVTAQNAAPISWQGGATQTVTWDVANTNAAPVSAANVNILLSTDGGQTFPTTLLANTPNDGTETITVPNTPTTTARIKIQPTNNIFFDINNANFTITAGVTITVNPATLPNGTVGTSYNQTVTASGGTPPYSFGVTAGNLPTGLTLTSGGTLSGTPTAAGTFNFTITATDANASTGSRAYTVTIAAATAGLLTVTNTDDSGAGSLRQAITDANANADANTIVFASPLFDTAQTITLTTALPNISNPLTITGRGARLLTVQRSTVAGTPNFSVFRNNFSNTAALSGMTVTNGRNTSGGGINNAGTLTLNGMNITGNFADVSNTNGGGGGIINGGSASILTILNSTISGNTNLTGRASGVRVSDGTVFIANSTISGNICASADTAGNGGIVVVAGTLNMNNVTVTNNSVTNNAGAATKTGGIFVGTATVNVRNTIIAGNTAPNGGTSPDVRGAFVSNGNNLVGNTTGGNGFTQPTDKTNVAANLAAIANNGGQTNTHALNTGSPALNAGDNCVVNLSCTANNPPVALTTDQRGSGFARNSGNFSFAEQLGGAAVDIGAFEAQVATAANASISGRVMTADGRGITNVWITVSGGSLSQPRTVRTSSFGYYRVEDLPAGETYILEIRAKRYSFTNPIRIISLTEDASEQNFIADEQ